MFLSIKNKRGALNPQGHPLPPTPAPPGPSYPSCVGPGDSSRRRHRSCRPAGGKEGGNQTPAAAHPRPPLPATDSSWQTLSGLHNSGQSPCSDTLPGKASSEPRVLAGLKISPSVQVQSHLHHRHLGAPGVQGRGTNAALGL